MQLHPTGKRARHTAALPPAVPPGAPLASRTAALCQDRGNPLTYSSSITSLRSSDVFFDSTHTHRTPENGRSTPSNVFTADRLNKRVESNNRVESKTRLSEGDEPKIRSLIHRGRNITPMHSPRENGGDFTPFRPLSATDDDSELSGLTLQPQMLRSQSSHSHALRAAASERSGAAPDARVRRISDEWVHLHHNPKPYSHVRCTKHSVLIPLVLLL